MTYSLTSGTLESCMFEPGTISQRTRQPAPSNPGPQQTDNWPLVGADLDPENLPSWVTWRRTCQTKAGDGQPCPRRWAASYFGLWLCDHHRPEASSYGLGIAVG